MRRRDAIEGGREQERSRDPNNFASRRERVSVGSNNDSLAAYSRLPYAGDFHRRVTEIAVERIGLIDRWNEFFEVNFYMCQRQPSRYLHSLNESALSHFARFLKEYVVTIC